MVGGLMVGGDGAEQEAAIGTAIDQGINYFDTAPLYGDGRSETNLGRALKALRQRPIVGTKVRLAADTSANLESRRGIPQAIAASVEASLRRLQLDRIDLLQLHNPVSADDGGAGLSADLVLGEIAPALQRLVRQGKIGYAGLTALGHAPTAIELAQSGSFDTAQVSYSLLNPSAAAPPPDDSAADDFRGMLAPLRRADMGVIGIRLLAGGSLSGVVERHPTAMPALIPLGRGRGSGRDYAQDVETARRFDFLVREGLAESLAAAALRYGLSNRGIHSLAVGFSSRDHLAEAIRCADAGPLEASTLDRIARTQRELGLAAWN
jgi:L-galactose dehydrogenase/L-glyceraldehyde 3-phosphate reductase